MLLGKSNTILVSIVLFNYVRECNKSYALYQNSVPKNSAPFDARYYHLLILYHKRNKKSSAKMDLLKVCLICLKVEMILELFSDTPYFGGTNVT